MSSRTNHDRCWAGSAHWLGFYPEQVIFEEHQDYLTKSSNVISTPRTSGPAESAGGLVKTNRWAHAQGFWLVGLGWGLRICICKFLGAANATIGPGAGLWEHWPRNRPLVHFPSALSSHQIWPWKVVVVVGRGRVGCGGALGLFSVCNPNGEQNQKNIFSVAWDEGQYSYGDLLEH